MNIKKIVKPQLVSLASSVTQKAAGTLQSASAEVLQGALAKADGRLQNAADKVGEFIKDKTANAGGLLKKGGEKASELLQDAAKKGSQLIQEKAEVALQAATSWGMKEVQSLLTKIVGSEIDLKMARRSTTFGTPILDRVVLQNQAGANAELSLTLNNAIVEASQDRRIEETSLQGRSGSVKEYIADGDWSLIIKGMIVADSKDTYPYEMIETLHNLCSVQKQIYIESDYVNQLLGVNSIVIKKVTLNQVEANMSQQKFEITAKSDVPFELEISRKNG